MKYEFKYTKEEERQKIIEDNKDKYLIEEQNIIEGNFLIFSDEKPLPPVIPPETVTISKKEYEDLQNQLLLSVNNSTEGGIF